MPSPHPRTDLKTSSETQRLHLDHLAVWRIRPSGATKARVLMIHGICEHSARHHNTVDALLKHGYEVIRFDLRGAGESGGERQYVTRFSDYVADAALVHGWIRRELEPLPLFLLGHSLGGAIAIEFASLYGNMLQGLILSAPAYKTGSAISPLVVWIGKRLVRLMPHLRIPSAPDNTSLSRDPSIAGAYRDDSLVCHFNTLSQGDAVLTALPAMPTRCMAIRCPTILFHGTHDRVILCSGSFELFNRLAAPDKVFHVLPGGFHEPHNDIDQVQYYALLSEWLRKHTPAV